MLKIKRLIFVLKRTGMIRMLIAFFFFLLICAFLLFLFDPGVKTFGDGIWYSFVASSTIGFGDICVSSAFGRILTIILSLYGILIAAMIPGVVVAYYTEYLKLREQETISTFLEKLEHLPELSKEELEELSQKVKRYNRKK